jgi:probable addiction module antidote protein
MMQWWNCCAKTRLLPMNTWPPHWRKPRNPAAASPVARLRHVAQAQGMEEVAERAGLRRESLYRALSPKGNPTLETLLAVLSAAGLRLAVARREEHPA